MQNIDRRVVSIIGDVYVEGNAPVDDTLVEDDVCISLTCLYYITDSKSLSYTIAVTYSVVNIRIIHFVDKHGTVGRWELGPIGRATMDIDHAACR